MLMFFVGYFVGAVTGILTLAIVTVASQDDDREGRG